MSERNLGEIDIKEVLRQTNALVEQIREYVEKNDERSVTTELQRLRALYLATKKLFDDRMPSKILELKDLALSKLVRTFKGKTVTQCLIFHGWGISGNPSVEWKEVEEGEEWDEKPEGLLATFRIEGNAEIVTIYQKYA